MLDGDVARVLSSARFDLVWLNKADPVLCFEVVHAGRIAYARDPDTENDFELKTKKTFWGYKHYLRRHTAHRSG